MEISIEQLQARYNKASNDKDAFRALYKDAYDLAIPSRNLYTGDDKGGKRTSQIFDSTGIEAVSKFVDKMQSLLTPPHHKWVELKAGPEIPERIKGDVNKDLELDTQTAFDIINASNFSTAVAEFYQDLSVGTAAMLVMPADGDKPINFTTVPIESLVFEEGPFGGIAGVFRKYKIPVGLILQQWRTAKLPHELIEMLQKSPQEAVEVFEALCPYDGRYIYKIIYEPTRSLMYEAYTSSHPWVITRWNKGPGELMGRGPLIEALPDLKTLNKVQELALRNAQLNVFGIYTVAHSDVINPNTLLINPGVMITVERNSGPNGPSIAPLPRSGDFNAQQFMVNELRERVMRIMLASALPPEEGGVRSATEIIARQREYQNQIGSPFGRLMYEFVQPLWQRIISILGDKGKLRLPVEFRRIDNFFVTIKVLSPIAKQQSLEEVQTLVQAYQIIAGINPQAASITFNMEKIGPFIAEKLGAPSAVLNTEDEQKTVVAELKQAMQMMAAQQMGVQGAA